MKKKVIRPLQKINEVFLVLRMSPNNIFIAVHNKKGHLLNWVSKGRPQNKYHKKVSNYALRTMLVQTITYIRTNKYYIKALTYRGRVFILPILRTLKKWKLLVWEVINRTPVPHNGCRGLKPRRL